MNPFLPPADLRAIHKRLGHLLPGAVHQLLRANEPVEGIEPLPPRPRKERKVRADPNATGKTVRAKVLSALTDKPQCYRDIAREAGLSVAVVRRCLSQLVYKRIAVNVARSGSFGAYTLPPVDVKAEQRGVFDV